MLLGTWACTGGTVNNSSPTAGSVTIVEGDQIVCNIVNDDKPPRSLSVTKTGTLNDGGDGIVNVGDTITYAFTVTNTGDLPITNISLSDPDATVSGGPIASLAAGASDSSTFTASYSLTQADIDAGSFTNTATVTGTDPYGDPVVGVSDDPTNPANVDPDGDGNPSDPTVIALAASSSLAVTKTATLNDGGDGIANVGDTISYAFAVTNLGNVTLTNISLTDPDAIIFGGPIPSLAVGATNSTTFTAGHVLTQADIDSGSYTNSATATGLNPAAELSRLFLMIRPIQQMPTRMEMGTHLIRQW